jgi:uncharacterized hydrophobic protein (TIGR00341 family)
MKLIEVVADEGHADTVLGIAEQQGAIDVWVSAARDEGRLSVRIVTEAEGTQQIIDALHPVIGASGDARVVIINVEASLPRPPEKEEDDEEDNRKEAQKTAASREELYNSIERNARLDTNFLLLVLLSTVVAAVGLIEDNVAVVIGAMVIAPLLGPNLAQALGVALGDRRLAWRALKTNLAGIVVAVVLSAVIGFVLRGDLVSDELLQRTEVGLDAVTLALASGAAAVLSISTGLPSVLVGVMVAVALLPPAATMGIMLGHGELHLAAGAALLLAVNVVCVNVAGVSVFALKGVRPRTWLERQRARQSVVLNLMVWGLSLVALIVLILLRRAA